MATCICHEAQKKLDALLFLFPVQSVFIDYKFNLIWAHSLIVSICAAINLFKTNPISIKSNAGGRLISNNRFCPTLVTLIICPRVDAKVSLSAPESNEGKVCLKTGQQRNSLHTKSRGTSMMIQKKILFSGKDPIDTRGFDGGKDGVFRGRVSINDEVEKGNVGIGSRNTGE